MTLFGTMILSDLQTRTLAMLISVVGNACLLEQEVGIMAQKINLGKKTKTNNASV